MNFKVFLISLMRFLCVIVESIQRGDFISITEAPYYASIINSDKESGCGAAIISEYWLVSAAHCVDINIVDWRRQKIRTGSTTSSSNGAIYNIDYVVKHENYSTIPDEAVGWTFTCDISLIKLKEPIKFNEYQQPIKLRSITPKENDTVTIVGLGYERVQKNPPALKKTVQSVAATGPLYFAKPPTVFHLKNSTSHLCPGDSGSPGIIDNELAGVFVIVDERCKDWFVSRKRKYPGALTRVDMFYNWVLNQTGIEY